MKMRALPGFFLLLLLLGTLLAPTGKVPTRGPIGTWHISQSTNSLAGRRSTLLEPPEESRAKIAAGYGKLPLSFEANQGQADAHVQFISRGSGYTLYLTSAEAVLTPRRSSASGEPPAEPGNPRVFSKRKGIGGTQEVKLEEIKHRVHGPVRMKLVGANVAAVVEGLQPLPGKSNYFIGNDPAKWRTAIPTYAKVRYKDLYPGVDLVYYGNQQQLEYDFIVAPGADPRAIRLAISGAKKLDAGAGGDLVLHTAEEEVRLRKPVVYQQVNGVRKEIAGRYLFRGKRQISFEVAAYDAGEPLIIDPVLSYSTYLGGSSSDVGHAIAVDASGNAYVTGSTSSANFPTKNPLQPALGGSSDAFVAKLDSTGSALIYSTYLGGSGDDFAEAIAVDASGNAYVTGSTTSSNFPTKNPFQAALGGPFAISAFLTKLDPTGSALVYSTYMGGSAQDSAKAIAVDPSGNAYVTGSTNSANFPTKNPFQAASGGGLDAFVAKLDPTGSALVYSTFLGGTMGDFGSGIAVDASGNAYVTGSTSSANFPTKNPLQPALGGSSNAFVAKLDSTGSALVYSTYLGGSGVDFANAIAVDPSGNAYVTGFTQSTNFPTASPFQASCQSCASGQGNAFVTKLSAAGSALVYSTYLGGNGSGNNGGDIGNGIVIDSSNNAYVTGSTDSPNFPLASPIQSSLVLQTCLDYYGYPFPCGNTAFVTKFNAAGSAPVYSTYLGASGGNFENGTGIAVDAAGNAYVTGIANSNFLLTPGAFQTSPGGNGDAFVAKISPNDAPGFSLSSFGLSFPDEGIGGTTAAQQITLANTGSMALTIASIVFSGGDFAETNTCGTSVAGGASCTISVTFTPTAAGVRTGTTTITDGAASSPQKIILTGNGIAGLSSTLAPTNLSFGNQTQGLTSTPQAVTFSNTGSATLTINGFSLGGTNQSDFALSSTNCGQSLAAGTSCTFNIVFAPQAVGNRSATLQVLDNSAQSPRSVALTGVGIAPPTVALSATSLSFAVQNVGSVSPPQNITLTTSGSGTLAIVSISTTTSDFGASNNCGNSVAGGASCTITVTFTPAAIGNRTGTLVIASNAANGTQMVSLSGVGGPDFSISPAAGSSSTATVTAGQTATYTVGVVGTSGFSGTVSLSCTSPSTQLTCTVSPNSLTLSGTSAQNATVTVTTTAQSAMPPRWLPPLLFPGLRVVLPWLLVFLSLVILIRALQQRFWRQRAWVGVGLAAMLMAAALFFGCGGGGPPPRNYQITVSATSAGVTQTTTLSLTVR
jgi:hypothetical protein